LEPAPVRPVSPLQARLRLEQTERCCTGVARRSPGRCAGTGSLDRYASGSQTSSATSYSTPDPLPSLRGRTSPVSVHTTSFSQRYRSSSDMGNAANELARSTRGAPRVSVPCEEHRRAAGCLKDAAKVWQEGVADPPPRVVRAAEAPRQAPLAVPLGDQEALPLCPGRAGRLHTPRLGRGERRPVQRLKAHRLS
jgi:hypothetical protein